MEFRQVRLCVLTFKLFLTHKAHALCCFIGRKAVAAATAIAKYQEKLIAELEAIQ